MSKSVISKDNKSKQKYTHLWSYYFGNTKLGRVYLYTYENKEGILRIYENWFEILKAQYKNINFTGNCFEWKLLMNKRDFRSDLHDSNLV